jgi:hypothetical protein
VYKRQAQDSFFECADPVALRRWLQGCWPEACDLSDGDLQRTLEQARQLYTETGVAPALPAGGPG